MGDECGFLGRISMPYKKGLISGSPANSKNRSKVCWKKIIFCLRLNTLVFFPFSKCYINQVKKLFACLNCNNVMYSYMFSLVFVHYHS